MICPLREHGTACVCVLTWRTACVRVCCIVLGVRLPLSPAPPERGWFEDARSSDLVVEESG